METQENSAAIQGSKAEIKLEWLAPVVESISIQLNTDSSIGTGADGQSDGANHS